MSVGSCLCGAEFATIRLLLQHSAEAHGRRPGVTYSKLAARTYIAAEQRTENQIGKWIKVGQLGARA